MLKNNILKRLQSDKGFMGYTHALSAVALYLLIGALFPSVLFNDFLGTKDLLIFFIAIFVTAGGALLPDLDNTKSTAISTLGPLGNILSWLMRSSATFVYSIAKSKYDSNNANPHRLFWHTILSVFIIWILVLTTTQINIPVEFFGKNMTIGFIFFLLWVYISVKISFAGLMPNFKAKMKRNGFIGFVVGELIAIIAVLLTLVYSNGMASYSWVAHCIALGYFIHILGDSMTAAGVPLLFPFKRKGKMWWNYSLLGIKAGGTVETLVFVPIFIVVIIASIIKIWFI